MTTTRNDPQNAADHAPTDDASIDGLLRRLDETVTIHQKWNRLAATIREERTDSLGAGCAQRANTLEWVLREMGEWDQ